RAARPDPRASLDKEGARRIISICDAGSTRRPSRGPREASPVGAAGRRGLSSSSSRTDRLTRWAQRPSGLFIFRAGGEVSLATPVGVFGATGYTGRELVRWLSVHPEAEVAFTTGSGEGHIAHEAGLERDAAAYCLALPHGVAARYAETLRRT